MTSMNNSPKIIKGASFSVCRTYRYELWRIWDETKPHVAWIGLNPSTADELTDDPTIRKCVGFAERWGFGGILMLNLFGFRATQRKTMKLAPDPVGPDNDRILLACFEKAPLIVAAWGTDGVHRGRDRAVGKMLNGRVKCLCTTKDGHPMHPLYVPYTQQLRDWAVAAS